MTTKELLALVGKWRVRADSLHGEGGRTYHIAADELAPIATALCAEVEAQALRIAQQDATIARLEADLKLCYDAALSARAALTQEQVK